MTNPSDEKLNRLLKEAYPSAGVSPDFTLRLWRRLMQAPARPPWMLPVPVVGLAVAVGIFAGVANWIQIFAPKVSLNQSVRLDLFGNAPFDTLAGSYLKLRGENG